MSNKKVVCYYLHQNGRGKKDFKMNVPSRHQIGIQFNNHNRIISWKLGQLMVQHASRVEGKNKKEYTYPIMTSNKKMVSTTSSVKVSIFC
jgi:hypothetical protein